MSEVKLGGRLFRKLKNGEKIEKEEFEAISDLLKIQEANLKVEEKTEIKEEPEIKEKLEVKEEPKKEEINLENADANLNKESEDELRLTEADILKNKLRISEEKQKELERKLKEVEQLGSTEFGEKSKPISNGQPMREGINRVR